MQKGSFWNAKGLHLECKRTTFSVLLYQNGCVSRYSLHSSGETKALGSGCLYRHIVYICVHHFGKTALHFGYVRIELGALGAHCCVNVAQSVAFGGDEFDCLAQQNLAVYIECLG